MQSSARLVDWADCERRLTEDVSVLVGADAGRYPSGNTLLVRGSREAVVIDPSVDVVERGGVPAAIDAVLNSHSHEDHIPGNGLFRDARIHVHEADLSGIQSIEGLMDIYGFNEESRPLFEKMFVERFHFDPRPDALGFGDGAIFDLGKTKIEAVHLPGHTRGHSGFRISQGVFFLSDIDLTGFGPYYGDAWSDLEDFEASLDRVRHEEADYYVTFHHKGVIEGRPRFLELLDDFAAVIPRRHEAMLEFLTEPRSIEEMAEHRFIYRPHVSSPITQHVERRSATLHVQRMCARGEANEVEPDRFQRR
jgi:glyoxylase-like metal-dependent hydrolase (beta-lactamase superfamily II)